MQKLTVDQALELITDKRPHTFTLSFAMMGANVDREELIVYLKASKQPITLVAKGSKMDAMQHNICFWNEKYQEKWYVEVNKKLVSEFYK